MFKRYTFSHGETGAGPLLQEKSLREIVRALRVSWRTATLWRSGEVIPHPARIELVRQWLLASADDGHVPAPSTPPSPS